MCSLGAQQGTAGIFGPTKIVLNNKVYPNPSSGLFHLKDVPNTSTIQVTDARGKTIKTLDPISTQVDLSDCESGVYFLKTEQGSARLIKL